MTRTYFLVLKIRLLGIFAGQEEKDELARQLEEAMTVEDANRKKIILKFKSR